MCNFYQRTGKMFHEGGIDEGRLKNVVLKKQIIGRKVAIRGGSRKED